MVSQNPLSWNVPIVDPKSGTPTLEFMRKWGLQTQINGTIPVLSTAAEVSAVLDVIGSTRGAFLERGSTGWSLLVPGTNGYVLKSAGSGADPVWASISSILDTISSTQGTVLYRDVSGWAALAPGTVGQVLTTGGPSANPAWAAGGGGGGGGVLPTIRASAIQAANASSFTVLWPTGTLAGDLAIIFAGHGCSINNPSGWKVLDTQSGNFANGAVLAKVLTTSDITAGSVTITTNCTFNGCFSIVTFVGATSAAFYFAGSRNNGASSPVSVNTTGYLPGAMSLAWGYNRGTGLGTYSAGTLLQSITTTDGCAALYKNVLTAPFVQTATFNSASSSNGYYLAAGQVNGP